MLADKFELINDDHVMLFSLIRCTDCGTYVHYWYDEEYEPHFRCPVCTDYNTNYLFWTAEEVRIDPEKQAFVGRQKEHAQIQVEQEERIKRRHGKQDYELATIKLRFPKGKRNWWSVDIHVNDIADRFPLTGLRLQLKKWAPTSWGGFTRIRSINIPLSCSALRCRRNIRKTRSSAVAV